MITPNSFDGSDSATWTLDFDMPPSSVFLKVFLCGYAEHTGYRGDSRAANIGILNFRRRKPDNSDETVLLKSALIKLGKWDAARPISMAKRDFVVSQKRTPGIRAGVIRLITNLPSSTPSSL
jgi:hypothetical protein